MSVYVSHLQKKEKKEGWAVCFCFRMHRFLWKDMYENGNIGLPPGIKMDRQKWEGDLLYL